MLDIKSSIQQLWLLIFLKASLLFSCCNSFIRVGLLLILHLVVLSIFNMFPETKLIQGFLNILHKTRYEWDFIRIPPYSSFCFFFGLQVSPMVIKQTVKRFTLSLNFWLTLTNLFFSFFSFLSKSPFSPGTGLHMVSAWILGNCSFGTNRVRLRVDLC